MVSPVRNASVFGANWSAKSGMKKVASVPRPAHMSLQEDCRALKRGAHPLHINKIQTLITKMAGSISSRAQWGGGGERCF